MKEHSILVYKSNPCGSTHITFKVIEVDKEDDTPRNPSHYWENSPAKYYDNLAVDFHFSKSGESLEPIGFKEIEYRDVFKVDLNISTKMHKTLASLSKKLTKLEDRYGYVKTPSDMLSRFADVIGAKRIYFYKLESKSSRYSNNEYKKLSIPSAMSELNTLIESIIDEG